MVDRSILEWTKKAIKNNTREEVIESLKNSGYSKTEIDEIFSSFEEPKKKSSLLPLIIVLAAIIFVSGSIFAVMNFFPKKTEPVSFMDVIRKDIVPAAVQIQCFDASGEVYGQGSGFFYKENNQLLVGTNAHVALADDGGFYGCNIFFPRNDGTFYDSAYSVNTAWLYHNVESEVFGETVKGIDFAILNISGPLNQESGEPFPFPPKAKSLFETVGKSCTKSEVSLGDKIYVIGYPGIGESSLSISDGIVSGFLGNFNEQIKVSANVNPGNSGGIALEADNGCFYGIPTWVSFDSAGGIGRLLSYSFITDFTNGLTGKNLEDTQVSFEGINYSTFIGPGISVDYPSGWDVEEVETGAAFISPAEYELDYRELVTLAYSIDPTETIGLEAYATEYMLALAYITDLDDYDAVDTFIGGQPGYVIAFKFKDKQGNEFDGIRVIVKNDNYFYVLGFQSRSTRFDSYAEVIKKMLSSFVFIE